MRRKWYLLPVIPCCFAALYFLQPVIFPAGDYPEAYRLRKNWPGLPAGFMLGNPSGVAADTGQLIVIFHRADRKWPLIGAMPETAITADPVIFVNRTTGKLVKSWGANRFRMPHGLTVDDQNQVWLTDVALHQVFKYTHDGRLLMKLGEAGKSGDDKHHFNKPTAVAVCPDGSFYVSDGYGNSRIMKFSRNGSFLFSWGRKGSGPGEFNVPHGITLDDKGNVYVADRENSRIQVFTASGKFIAAWHNKSFGHITSVAWEKKSRHLVATDDLSFLSVKHRGSDVLVFDNDGKLLHRFGRTQHGDGTARWFHAVCTDREGAIIAADILENNVLKFEIIP